MLKRVAKKENQIGAGSRTGRDLQTAASDLELNFFHLSGAHGTGEPKVKATARQDKTRGRPAYFLFHHQRASERATL